MIKSAIYPPKSESSSVDMSTIQRTSSLYDQEQESVGRNNDYYSSDEDDPKWTLDSNLKPLVNVVAFGWTEDGRCGTAPEPEQKYQWCPKPISALRSSPDLSDPFKEQFVCKQAKAGSRHTALLMIDCAHRKGWKPQKKKDQTHHASARSGFEYDDDEGEDKVPPRKLKVKLCGLNQTGLCEEKGHDDPVDINFDCSESGERPAFLEAGRGNTFIITKRGRLYSFGNGSYGILGHGDCYSTQVPTLMQSLAKKCVVKVAVGGHHVFVMTEDERMYGWGRNHCGQLGRGFESNYEMQPAVVEFEKLARYRLIDIACGEQHTLAVLAISNSSSSSSSNKDEGGSNTSTSTNTSSSTIENMVYCWGDHSRGQLGSADATNRMRPQNNRWLQKFMKRNKLRVHKIIAGGYHNFVVVKMSGQVIAWGANDYGQLGNGFQWDDPQPRFMNNMKSVVSISAGLRHNLAICEHESREVYGWGYNAYGELGLGDTLIRLQPTKLTAIRNSRVISVSCGDRHSVVVTSHKPIAAKEDTVLKPYFRILEKEGHNKMIMKRLKWSMTKSGLDASALDEPNKILPDQVGSRDGELHNDLFEKGLRYCLDTFSDKNDWRRKAMETCFECFTKTQHLKSVCLSCARNCLSHYRLRPYIKWRQPGDTCDCRFSGLCRCSWSRVRAAFDRIAGDDKCIAPKQCRELLKSLRYPYPIEGADVEDCLLTLAEGREDEDVPRIAAVPFEKWYQKYYDERNPDEGDSDEEEKSLAATLKAPVGKST